jgi:hypothetical protein
MTVENVRPTRPEECDKGGKEDIFLGRDDLQRADPQDLSPMGEEGGFFIPVACAAGAVAQKPTWSASSTYTPVAYSLLLL